MTATLDRAAFFTRVRKLPFGGSLTQRQVNGLTTLLDAAPALLGTTSLACALGTVFHETARTMEPIEEYGRGKGRAYGPTGFWGRGYVQLTWEANYRKATKRLRELGILKPNEDLVKTPALAMRPDVAAAILYVGMSEGWFTGKKFSDYFGGGRYDVIGSRKIINGTDRAALIAGYIGHFVDALRAAGHSPIPITLPARPVIAELSNPTAQAIDQIEPSPLPVPQPPMVTTGGFWTTLKALFRKDAA